MKTGCMIYGLHSRSLEERHLAYEIADALTSRGRQNVFVSFLDDDPYSVMVNKYEKEGIDTFVIIPLCISEGKQTVWDMPAAIHLPDNSGSWTMVGEHDVATRFATAMGRNQNIAEALAKRLGEPDDATGILILAYGSNLSQCSRTATYYSDHIRDKGWKTAYGFTRIGGPDVKQAAEELLSKGCSKIITIPLFITFSGSSAEKARTTLAESGAEVSFIEPVSHLPEFLDVIDSKIPEGW